MFYFQYLFYFNIKFVTFYDAISKLDYLTHKKVKLSQRFFGLKLIIIIANLATEGGKLKKFQGRHI